MTKKFSKRPCSARGYHPHALPKTTVFWLHSCREHYESSLCQFDATGSEIYTDIGELTITAMTPFKVIQGHRFQYQPKAFMRLPISI